MGDERAPRAKKDVRVPTPVVLAVSSSMLAVAAVVFVGTLDEAEETAPTAIETAAALHVDDSTPEATVESFYDAWRRRRWSAALELSAGAAREDVLEKQRRDDAMPPDERVVAAATWEALSSAPLTMALDRVDMLPDDQYALSGSAEYLLAGHPYVRRVDFLVVPADGHYRVAEMTLGEVTTELPEIFRATTPEGP